MAKPKDKAKVEGSVLIVEREIIVPLRNHTLIGLAGAKKAIWEKLQALNKGPRCQAIRLSVQGRSSLLGIVLPYRFL